jgi:hypothetical protein
MNDIVVSQRAGAPIREVLELPATKEQALILCWDT